MKQIIILATRNKGKVREFSKLLNHPSIEIRNLDDFGPIPEVVEDGDTFDDNAYKKASFTARVLGYPAIADDSGLCVDGLDGAPGVLSARYAGESATDADNVKKLLNDIKPETNRKASFKCVISIAMPQGAALTYEGQCQGIIIDEPRGENGFGYDPIFFYPELNKTFAELTVEEKGRVSHRGKALKEVAEEMDNIIKWIEMHQPNVEPVSCMGKNHET
jgi:XTP/dITP diphosphohydrolase